MIYDHLGQEATTMAVTNPSSPSSGIRSFFRPITRFFPRFFPIQPRYTFVDEGCIPVGPLPAGTLGRDSNGNLTVNGQTYCNQRQPNYFGGPSYRGPINLY
jgi:hypothetical protein